MALEWNNVCAQLELPFKFGLGLHSQLTNLGRVHLVEIRDEVYELGLGARGKRNREVRHGIDGDVAHALGNR